MSRYGMLIIIIAIALTLACGTVNAITPTPQSILPSEAVSPLSQAIKSSQSVAPTIPKGFLNATEENIGISIARPINWERDAGTKILPVSGAPVDYVVYYYIEPGIIKMISIQTLGIYYPYKSDDDLISGVLGIYADQVVEKNLKVLDFANEVIVANLPAQAISYRIDDQRTDLPLFSITLIISTPDDSAIFLQWAANENMQKETTDLFLKMLPTIRISQ